ncbi:MAG: winged helix-turn-helix domain-containing protein [Desulfovibrio sp.]|jgi:transposase|nr:winged helix-turn-helix domain-containing protein [Desulfovibrio sp.]
MARLPRGKEVLTKARQQLAKTNDANELRVLQAVVFPLVNGMSTQETALALGRSPRWVTMARNAYIREAETKRGKTQTIRNHAYMSLAEEKEFLAPFLEKARCGGVLVVNEIHRAMEKHLGGKVALASAYNLLHRHNWRKLAPDRRNVEADVQAQEEWKKNCRTDLLKSHRSGKGQDKSD